MSEGGLFAWKIQTIRQRGPAASYSNMSLPRPPKGQHWIQNIDTREWYLTEITTISEPQASSSDEAASDTVQLPEAEAVVVVRVGEDDVVVQEATAEEEPLPGFIQHKILPTDTFQGICLKYRITPSELRRANGGLSGTTSNLNLMPNPLRIPVNQKYVDSTTSSSSNNINGNNGKKAVTVSDKLRALQTNCPTLHKTEAKCYLELNDWSVVKATENAREDGF